MDEEVPKNGPKRSPLKGVIHDLKLGFSWKSTICDFTDELRHVCFSDSLFVLFATLWSRVSIGIKIEAPTDLYRAIAAALSRLLKILKILLLLSGLSYSQFQ